MRRTVLMLVAVIGVLASSCGGAATDSTRADVSAGSESRSTTVATTTVPASSTTIAASVESPDRNVLLLDQLSNGEADPAWSGLSDDEKIALAQELCNLADTYPSGTDLIIGLWSNRDTGLQIGPEMVGNLAAAVWTVEYCSTTAQRTVIGELVAGMAHPLFAMRIFCDSTDLGTESEELYGITAFYICPDGTALESLAEVVTPQGRALFTFEGAINLCVDVESFSYLYGETWVAPLRAAAADIDDDYRAVLAEAVEGTWNTVECDDFLAVIGAADFGGAVIADLGYREASYDELQEILNE
jgi:hypothetical protein